MSRFLELPKSSLFCWFLSVLVLASCSYGSFPIPVVVFQKLHTAHVHKFCSIKISTLIWQSSLEAPGTANTIMICSNYKLNMYICLHSCLCCKLLQLVLVKLERLVKPLSPVLLPSCQFLYRGSEVPPCSARSVPGFGWRNAFGSNHPLPGVIDQANGH